MKDALVTPPNKTSVKSPATATGKSTAYSADFWHEGGRIGVLFIHSLGSAPLEVRSMCTSLAQAGYTVSCPYLKSLGDGSDLAGRHTNDDWYREVVAAFETLSRKCDAVIVAGVSVGGMLALRLAAERQKDIHGLMLYAPTFWPNGWAIPWYFNFFRIVLQKWVARLFRFTLKPPYGIKDERKRQFMVDIVTEKGTRSLDDVFGRSGGVIQEMRWLSEKVTPRLGEIMLDALILHPREDDQSALSTPIKILNRLKGNVEMHVLNDCYHRITMDKQSRFVEERTLDYVTRMARLIAAKPKALSA